MNDIRTSYNAIERLCGVLTVDSDGDGLRENEAVSTLESRDLAKLVDLQILGRDALGRLSVDKFDVKTVLLCDSKEGGGARVTLLVDCQFCGFHPKFGMIARKTTYAVAVDLSERHDCWFTVSGTVQSIEAKALEERKKVVWVEVGVGWFSLSSSH